ncbi:MAG: SDR family oxidoreductase [Bacteroidia bacterium]
MDVLITGASSGVGRALTEYFLNSSDMHVIAISRNHSKLDELFRSAEAMGKANRLSIFAGDIREEKFLQSVYSALEREGRRVRFIVNNAGKLIRKSFRELTAEQWQEIYSVNVFAVASVVRIFYPMLITGEALHQSAFCSHIVNIGSVGGVQGSIKFAGLSAYSSSKGAMSVLTECMAEEFKQERIAVNCLALGSVQTEMFSDAFPGFSAAVGPGEMAGYIGEFVMKGHCFFNGKVLPVSFQTP